MWDWLRHHDRTRVCVATKADKVGRSAWPKHLKEIQQGLGLAPASPSEPLILFSAEAGLGRDEVWRWMTEKAH